MGIIDQLSKSLTQGIDRAKFEAEKFQKTARIQGEINNLKRAIDSKLIDLGYRASELYRAGQITSPSVSELVKVIDELHANIVVKEEELKTAQAEAYIEPEPAPPPPPPPSPVVQPIPIEHDAPPQAAAPPQPPVSPPPAANTTKACPACGFQMPMRAVYCPNCGYHVGS